MKLNHKILIMLISIILWSCSDDVPVRDVSPVASNTSMKVYFPKTNVSVLEVEPQVKEVTVVVSRVNTASKVVVPLKAVDKAKVFTVPQTVTFEAGEAEADVVISFANLKFFEVYMLELSVDTEFGNPYVINNEGSTNFVMHLKQSDWQEYADATFASEFFEEAWEQKVYYSEILKSYKLIDLYSEGYDFTFKVGEDNIVSFTKQPTGYVHSTYGMVSFDPKDADGVVIGSTKEGKVIALKGRFTVAAGSFGTFTEVLTLP